MHKRTIERALKAVNKARKALGLRALKKMPKGDMNQAESCPIANCFPDPFDATVSGASVYFCKGAVKIAEVWGGMKSGYRYRVMAPKSIENFVREFDKQGEL